MTNRVIEGFDWFPSGMGELERARLWAAAGYYDSVDDGSAGVATGRFGFGKAFTYNTFSVFSSLGQYVIPLDPVGTEAEGFIGVAVYRGSTNANEVHPFISFYDAFHDVPQVSFSFDQNGLINAWRGWPHNISVQFGELIGSSAIGSFQDNNWFFFEARALIGNSGSFECRVNTKTVMSYPAVDTQNSSTAGFDSVCIGYTKDNANKIRDFYFDDLYCNDVDGSVNNGFLGNNRVKTQAMVSDGDNIDFSIGGSSPAATNWQSVLNTTLDDTKYVYSPNVGDYDLYDVDPILNAAYVNAVQVRIAYRQDDATQRTAVNVLKTGGTVYDGSVVHYLNQTYTFYKETWELNPDTGVGWTGSEVNGLQVGPKINS